VRLFNEVMLVGISDVICRQYFA